MQKNNNSSEQKLKMFYHNFKNVLENIVFSHKKYLVLLCPRSRESELTQTVNATKRRLNNLIASKNDRFKLYGEQIPALLNEIKKSREFHKKPLGPVGMWNSSRMLIFTGWCRKNATHLNIWCDQKMSASCICYLVEHSYSNWRRPWSLILGKTCEY